MSADDRSVGERLVAGAVEEPVLGLFVTVMLLMALGFLVAFVIFLA